MGDLRRARPEDAHEVAPLLVEAAPNLRLLLGGEHEAWHAAEATYRHQRTTFSHRYGMVAEDGGSVAGVVVAFPGRLWGSLKLGTGVVLAREAGVRHASDLVRRGRVLDRLLGEAPRDTLYVSALAVAKERRRRGIGRALMERVIAGASGLGLGVSLDVDLDAEGARKLYEGLGFMEVRVAEATAHQRALVETSGFARLVRPRPA